MNVAFFGGSFDPPHIGHVLAAAYARSIGFDRVLVAVVKSHAFAKRLTPFAVRLDLARRAFAPLSGVEVTDIEARLPEPNYTLHTVQAVKAEHADWELRLLAGSDVEPDFERWYGFEELRRLAPPLLLGRGGYAEQGTIVLPQVSSTEARQKLRVRYQDPEARAWLETHLPRDVLAAIDAEALYLDASPHPV